MQPSTNRRRGAVSRRSPPPGHVRDGPDQQPGGDELALADALLAVITAGMLISGFWDWFGGHPNKVRWHAITLVGLAILLLIHTVRRWSRLRRSKIR